MSRLAFILLLVLLYGPSVWGQTQLTASSNGTIYQGHIFSLDQWQWQVYSDQHLGQPAFIQVSVYGPSGELVYRIAGHPFSLTGQSFYSGINLNRTETQFVAPAYQRSLDRLHCLPRGKYLIESTLLLVAAPDNQPIAQHRQTWYQRQSCTQQIVPLMPGNNTSVCATYPVFRWTAAGTTPDLTYEFILYENTNDTEKLTEPTGNRPLIQITATAPVYQFAPGELPLEKGRRYSWQILAHDAGNLTGQSPVQHFVYGCAEEQEKEKLPVRPVYLKTGAEGHFPAYTLQEPILHFSFVQRIPGDQYQLEVKDEQGNTLVHQPVTTRTGYNYLSLPFAEIGLPEMKDGRLLTVRLLSERGDKSGFSVRIEHP